MPNYLRPRVTGATIFFTVALAERGSRLLVDEITRLRAAVSATRADRPFRVDAWVVLPDHMHCVWTLPGGDRDFSTRWGAIKARFSVSMRGAGYVPPTPKGRRRGGVNPALRRKGEVGLWQPRFWEHHICNEADYAAHVRYCWINPVKHGLAARPADWPFSSIHRDIRAGRVEPEFGTLREGGVHPAAAVGLGMAG